MSHASHAAIRRRPRSVAALSMRLGCSPTFVAAGVGFANRPVGSTTSRPVLPVSRTGIPISQPVATASRPVIANRATRTAATIARSVRNQGSAPHAAPHPTPADSAARPMTRTNSPSRFARCDCPSKTAGCALKNVNPPPEILLPCIFFHNLRVENATLGLIRKTWEA